MASNSTGRYYIYCFIDGHEILYIGKGSGRRVNAQARRFSCEYKILERTDDEEFAYYREKHWIAQLQPTLNMNKGGGGSISSDIVPLQYRRLFTLKEWKKSKVESTREAREIERVGSRKYAAQILLKKVDERNCSQFGLSEVDVNRWREVANGPRC